MLAISAIAQGSLVDSKTPVNKASSNMGWTACLSMCTNHQKRNLSQPQKPVNNTAHQHHIRVSEINTVKAIRMNITHLCSRNQDAITTLRLHKLEYILLLSKVKLKAHSSHNIIKTIAF
jgi:hypothetical protein